MTFDTAVAHLKTLGVTYTQDYDYGKQGGEKRHRFDVPVFTNVTPPFSAKEWCSLCMNEGDHYIGGCCGTTSAAQDIINYMFRSGGYIEADNFHELAGLLANHDELDSEFMFSKPPAEEDDAAMAAFVASAKAQWDRISPWQKLAVIYPIVRTHLRQRLPTGVGKHFSPLESAIHTAEQSLRALSYEQLFNRGDRERTDQDRAMRTLVLMRAMPAVKTVYDGLASLYEGPVEGYALIDRAHDDAIAENRFGYVIHSTRAQIDEIVRITREQEKHYEEQVERLKPLEERVGIRRVRVTLEKGIEFLGEIEVIDG